MTSSPGWQPLESAGDWNAMEQRTLERWRDERVFHRSMEQRAGSPPYVFYEGPPTANGRPGVHHVLSRVFKDIFPRYWTMRGRFVDRRGGWDCHGLPVELEVEKQLGISGKPEIEAYGIAEFNARCRDSVLTYLDEWERLTERIAFWVDTDRAYRTMDSTFIESVWWAIAELWRKGLLFESDKVVPYCGRCGTALSSHEVAQGYQDVEDPSVYVRFPLGDESGTSLLVWTTTPWTLPSNQGVAVRPGISYAVVDADGERLVVAEALVEKVFGDGARVVETRTAESLVGSTYEPPFDLIPGRHVVIPADFVTTDDGTGLVHLAPAFGEDDMAAGREHGLDAPNPIDRQGRFTAQVPLVEGVFAKDADPVLIDDLTARGRLWKAAQYTHSYPHCWRCRTPLLYYAKPSWYIRTTAVRERMMEINAQIGWNPERVRDGRFGKWLEGNVDWAISRERYWGTPLPLWRCADPTCGHVEAIGAFAELNTRAGRDADEVFDPHRPYVDALDITCAQCGGVSHRVPEVLDVWFDSGAMPFAQDHYPFAVDSLEGRLPADFICEAIDQTRGWFYSLLAESTLLFDQTSYRNVVCLGLILDADGQKMSKSRGNVVEPWSVIDAHGVDAFRWYLLTAQSPWEPSRFSFDAINESKRSLLTLWNTFMFLVTYASLPDGWSPGGDDPDPAGRRPIDRWILSRRDQLVEAVTHHLADYDTLSAGRAIDQFVDDLSNWYVRVSRARFWGGRQGEAAADADARAAFATLHECLTTTALVIAPFCPFVADEMYRALVSDHDPAAPDSVHLADWPTPMGLRDEEAERRMAAVRTAVGLGRYARAESKLKVRQPLAEAVIACPAAVARDIAPLSALVEEELNVHSIRFVTDPGELVEVTIKPNYRTLGPRFGKAMPQLAAAVAALDPAATARAVDAGESVTVEVDGASHTLAPEDLLLTARSTEGYAVGQDAGVAVGLATEITPALRMEGLAREVVHAVQNARKNAGLQVQDRIVLHLDGSGVLREAIDAHREQIAGETLATALTVGHGAPFAGIHNDALEVDGEPLAVRIDRAV